MNDTPYHIPVMVAEVQEYLITQPDGVYVDCTLGGGGHSRTLLEHFPTLRIIGIDCDEAALHEAGRVLAPFGERVTILRENFSNIRALFKERSLPKVNGILADLGVSSKQFDDYARGFSFQSETLDMRMDARLGRGAEDLINTLDDTSLADIFYHYGEERFSRPIARRIVEERKKGKISSGRTLADIVERVKHRTGRVHPATQVFQALRIAVNKELEVLSAFLDSIPELLVEGGRAVIISYHSLEDRIVKQQFRKTAQEGAYHLLTKKVVCPSADEERNNPRSRSAKLRAAERTGIRKTD